MYLKYLHTAFPVCRLRANADASATALPTAVITPVRRSTRKSVASLPVWLRDHDTVLTSLDDLSPSVQRNVLFQDNRALVFDRNGDDDDGDDDDDDDCN